MGSEKAIEKLLGYDVFLADSSLLTPLSCEEKPKIVICCPSQKAMDDMQDILRILATLKKPAESNFNYSKTEVQKIVERQLRKKLLPETGSSIIKDIAEELYYYLACQKIKADCKPAPTGQEAGELVKDLRILQGNLPALGLNCIAESNLVGQAADEIDRLEGELQKRQSTSEYDEGRANADTALEKENKRLKEEARWIPVSERLPEEGQYVLLANNYKVIDMNWYKNTLRKFDGYTHWKPIVLPEQALKEK